MLNKASASTVLTYVDIMYISVINIIKLRSYLSLLWSKKHQVHFVTRPWFVYVEVLRPSQPNGVMSSPASLPNHTFTGQAYSSKRLTNIVHILLPETDNCPSWISGRERMTVENISWSISMKKCCRPRQGLNPRPPGLQSDGPSNWATEASYSAMMYTCKKHQVTLQ